MTTPRNLSRLASGANTSGVLSMDKGGTGAATAADAKTALNLHTVATTGSYNDLTDKPVVGDALPSQTGNTGKYLTTDGTTASWATVSGGGGGSGSSTSRTVFTATAAQTTFTVSYVVGQIDVYMNGSKLLIGTDVTATSGTNIVLASGAAAGDIIETVVYSTQWVTSGTSLYYSSGAVLGGTTTSTGSSPMRFQAKGGAGGTAPYAGYSLISGFDEVSGYMYISSSGENSIQIAADPQNLRASSSIQFSTDGSEKVRIIDSGHVGIGTSSPSQKLEVAGNIYINTSGNPTMTVKTTGSGNNPLYRLQADTNYWEMLGVFSDSNDTLRFRYNDSDKLILTNDGRVGINNSNPSASAQYFALNGNGYSGGNGSGTVGSSLSQVVWSGFNLDNSGPVNPVGFRIHGGGGGVPRGFMTGFYGKGTDTGSNQMFFTTNTGNSPQDTGRKAPSAGVYRGPIDTTTFSPTNDFSFLVNNGGMTGFGVYDVYPSDWDGTQKAGVQVRLGGTYGGGSPGAWGGFCYTAYINTNFGAGSQGTNWGYYADITNAGSGNNWGVYIQNGNAAKPGGGSWTATSDARVKTITSQYDRGLSEILQLNVVNYKYNGKGGHQANDQVLTGVIAQELQQVFPEMVSSRLGKLEETDTEDTQILMVDNSALVYALVNSVKELKEIVDAQAIEIAALKGQLNG